MLTIPSKDLNSNLFFLNCNNQPTQLWMNAKFDKNILHIYILNVYVHWADSIEKNTWYLESLGMLDDYFLSIFSMEILLFKRKKNLMSFFKQLKYLINQFLY